MARASSKRSTGSGTASRWRSRLSLRVTLFIVILMVALVCVLASALLSNYLSHRQIGEFVKQHEAELQGTTPANPVPAPGQNPALPPGQPPAPQPPPPPQPKNINMGFVIAGLLGLVLALTLSFLLAGRIARPLSGLTAAARGITGGDYERRVDAGGGREVEELSDAFNTLADSLERNEQLRRNMVADIAHELRTPLATLRGQLELLQEGKLACDRENIDSLMEDAVVLSRLVDDLQQLTLVEAGQLKLDIAPVDAAALLEEVASRFAHEASFKQLSLSVDATAGLPAVPADKLRLGQVLGNLVSNSISHTPAGGRVTLAARLAADGKVIQFSVSDTGAGVSAEELPFIFERFYRTDRSRTRSTGGAGIGLSIAKSLVEAHGGSIGAESEAGSGTTITFTVPLQQQ